MNTCYLFQAYSSNITARDSNPGSLSRESDDGEAIASLHYLGFQS